MEHGSDIGIDCSHVHRIGIPDRFVEHGERSELFAELKLDADGIASVCRQLANQPATPVEEASESLPSQ